MDNWSFSLPGLWLVLLALVWCASAWVCWANWHRRRTRAAAAMEGLRFLIVSLIMITVAKPEFIKRLVHTDPPEVVILADRSESMQTRDLALGDSATARAEWLDTVLQTNFWQWMEGQATVLIEEFGGSTNDPAAAGTDLSRALDGVLQRQRNLKAVLLLTDGDWNVGRSPVAAAVQFRTRGVPVYTVGIGNEKPLPDLVMEEVVAPSYGLLGEQIAIPFRVVSHLPRDVKTTVELTSARGVSVSKPIVVPAFSTVQDSVIWAPRALGSYSLNLRLPVQDDEYLTDNNDRSFRVAIRTEKLRVLVVDSFPRWEYRFLRNALSRDPGVEVDCLLWHPGMEAGRGRDYISQFPATREEIARYDVVFLGDVGLGGGELQEKDLELIKGLVEQQGSGLVFLPGARGRQSTLVESPLADLLPVQYELNQPTGLSGALESRLVPTSSGRRHFLTMLAADPSRNEAVWRSLPGFYWSAAVLKSRPGSDVLAVHESTRNAAGRLPLLVTRPYGNGEVLFMGTDSAWRWRRGVEDTYHYRFWGQVVRWMSHKRHMARGEGLRLTFNPESPVAGSTLYLQAALQDLGSFDRPEEVTATITSPSGTTERLNLAPASGGWGIYTGRFTPQEGGAHRVVLQTSRANHRLEVEVDVTQPQVEKQGQPANLSVLREIAQLTEGRFGLAQDLEQLVREVALLPEAAPLEQRIRLWANPWWGGLILLLLVIYWTARKVAGMV